MLPRPLVIVNVKAYERGVGERLEPLLDAVEEVGDERVVVAAQTADLHRVAARDLPALAQHVDPDPPGSHTGATSPEAVRDAGAAGSLLNHSERPMRLTDLAAGVRRLADLDLTSVVCADTVPAARAVAALGPDMVAIEPPELIGGDVSVTTADPGIVEGAVEAVRGVAPDVDVLCGAGVKTGGDVAQARKLGTEGVLLASGVVKADDPKTVLGDLIGGLDR